MSLENGVTLLDKLKLRLERDGASDWEAKQKEEWFQQSRECLLRLEAVIDEVATSEGGRDVEKRAFVSECVLILSSHRIKHNLTNASTRELSKKLLTKLSVCCGCSSVSQLLVGRDLDDPTPKSSPYLPVDTWGEDEGASVEGLADDPGWEGGSRMKGIAFQTGSDSTRGSDLPPGSDSTRGSDLPSGSDSTRGSDLPAGSDNTRGSDLPPGSDNRRGSDLPAGSDSHVTVMCSNQFLVTNGVLKDILMKLKDNLTSELWKKRPTYKHAFVWCLRNITHPHVGTHLQSLLPPLLMLVDDYEVHHKVTGLQCLSHLMRNVNPSELRWHGQAMVIYQVSEFVSFPGHVTDAISNLVYNNDVSIINAFHPCVLHLLPILEGPPPLHLKEPKCRSFSDEMFDKMLNSLEIESKTPQCQALTSHLSAYVVLLGVGVIRHLPRLLRVIYQCVRHPDYTGEHTRRNSLRALNTAMKVAWVRVPSHKDEILKSLLMLIVDCCHGDKGALPSTGHPDHSVLNSVVSCLVTLECVCGALQPHMSKLELECGHDGLKYCIDKWQKELQHTPAAS